MFNGSQLFEFESMEMLYHRRDPSGRTPRAVGEGRMSEWCTPSPRRPLGLPLPVLVVMVLALVAAGCGAPTAPSGSPAPQASGAAPIPVVTIEIRSLPSSNPRPEFVATCQTGAAVLLSAAGSVDPAGLPLVYEWRDSVEGELTADFRPRANPLQTTEAEVSTGLYTIGIHDITLTIRATDGRKAKLTLQVLVTSCESCGE